MYLSWIIPAYNEERRIEKTLREVHDYLSSRRFPGGHEIIVADASSKDKTAAMTENLRSEVPGLRLLTVANRGKGYAVRRGMFEAKGHIRIFSDADNSTKPEYFDVMKKLFDEGYDMVISSRNPKDAPGAGRDKEEPWYRELLGMMGNLVIQRVGVWGIWDTQNGFKAFTARAAEDLFSRARMDGWSFDIEILALAQSLEYRIGIIPVRWVFDPDSKVTPGAYLQVLRDVFLIRKNLILGSYRKKPPRPEPETRSSS
jgi:glycosyltransferase involved in cell wall biosynthesis